MYRAGAEVARYALPSIDSNGFILDANNTVSGFLYYVSSSLGNFVLVLAVFVTYMPLTCGGRIYIEYVISVSHVDSIHLDLLILFVTIATQCMIVVSRDQEGLLPAPGCGQSTLRDESILKRSSNGQPLKIY